MVTGRPWVTQKGHRPASRSDCLSPQGTLREAGGDPSPGFDEVGRKQGCCQDCYFWNMIGRMKVTSARREVNYTLVSGFLESCPTNTKQTQGKVTSMVGIVIRGCSGPPGADSLCPGTRPLPLAGPEQVPNPTEPAVGWERQSLPPWGVAVPLGLTQRCREQWGHPRPFQVHRWTVRSQPSPDLHPA